jgi:hypothetical protein
MARVRVVFPLDAKDWHGYSTESLWADKVGRAKYKIINAPFFAKGLSFHDIVIGKRFRAGRVTFDSVVERGGFSAFHLVAKTERQSSEAFKHLLDRLRVCGADYEKGDFDTIVVYALSVPPSADIGEIYNLLEEGRGREVWDWELGHDGHPPDDP